MRNIAINQLDDGTQELDLSFSYIEDKDVPQLKDALDISTNLTRLDLSDTHFSQENIRGLLKKLTSIITIRELNLNNNELRHISISNVCNLVQSGFLRSLSLKGMKIIPGGMDRFAGTLGDSLSLNSTLAEIYLNNTAIKDSGANSLISGLSQSHTIKTISLWRCELTDACAVTIGDMIQSNSSLTTLRLGYNHFTDQGVWTLATSLAINKSIIVLDVSRNTYADARVQDVISTCLERNVLIQEKDNLLGFGFNKERTVNGYKKRLFIGEGNFSFVEAILNKHTKLKDLGSAFTATEYLTENNLSRVHGQSFCTRLDFLRSKNVTIKFNIDAEKLHKLFEKQHFPHIHFNCPFGSATHYVELSDMLYGFFTSCSSLQNVGDKVHMALVKEGTYWEKYNVGEVAAYAGYVCNKRRVFNADRYPGYQHCRTGKSQGAQAAEGKTDEYIFEKTALPFTGILRDYKLDYKNYEKGKIQEILSSRNTDPNCSDDEEYKEKGIF